MPAPAGSGDKGAGHGVHVPVKKPAGVKELDNQYPDPERAFWCVEECFQAAKNEAGMDHYQVRRLFSAFCGPPRDEQHARHWSRWRHHRHERASHFHYQRQRLIDH